MINAEFLSLMSEALDKIQSEIPVPGVVLTSAKKTFLAGGDLEWIYEFTNQQDVFNSIQLFKEKTRTLETLGLPVVAAINGTALGGGFELALTCHHRIAIDSSKTNIGLPEVTLGLLPGAGGVARLTRRIGLESAFPFLLEGKQVKPCAALKAGLIDDLALDRVDLMAKAKDWILANPVSAQPWDKKNFKIPGGNPHNPNVTEMLAIAPAMLKKKTLKKKTLK